MRILARTEVLVVGGGPAGVTAAVAAARNGADVLLVERYGFLGGAATAALVGPWWAFHTPRGEQVIHGIAQEIVDRLVSRGGSPGHLPDIPCGSTSTMTPVDADQLRLVALEMVHVARVRMLLHTWVTDAVVEGQRVRGVVVRHKGGEGLVLADAVVDASGDADVAAAAGVPFHKGRPGDGLLQPMTLMFIVGGIDIERVWTYLQAHPDQVELGRDPHTGIGQHGVGEYTADQVNTIVGFYDVVARAIAAGEFPPYRNRICLYRTPRVGEWTVNTTRVLKVDGTEATDLTRAEVESRQQADALVRIMRREIPGCEKAYIAHSPAQVGVRETRRIVGRHVLTGEEVLEETRFPDGVACGCFPIDIHQPDGNQATHSQMRRGGYYTVPYRCLVPQEIHGMLVAGRAISADSQAFGSIRIQSTCMAVGQAAGTAAALGVRQGVLPDEVDVTQLRAVLRDQGARVD